MNTAIQATASKSGSDQISAEKSKLEENHLPQFTGL
jgi:hypothetical protein